MEPIRQARRRSISNTATAVDSLPTSMESTDHLVGNELGDVAPVLHHHRGALPWGKAILLLLVGVAFLIVESILYSRESDSISINHLRSSEVTDRDLLTIQTRIVGGTNAAEGEFPFIVALYRTTDINLDREPVCGGSLITPSIVLTAAHCIGDFKRVEINRYKQSDDRDVDRYFNFEQRIHPSYNPKIVDYDVGLIKLPTPQLVATPISLATTETQIPESMTVMGWGQLSLDGQQPDTLQQVSVNPLAQDKCRKAYEGFTITDRMFCAETPGKDACLGDSGGPAVIAGENIQIGVVSWGIGCADGIHPGVYARVSNLRGWIEEAVCRDLSPGDCVHGNLPSYAVAASTPTPVLATPQPSPLTPRPTVTESTSPTYISTTFAPTYYSSSTSNPVQTPQPSAASKAPSQAPSSSPVSPKPTLIAKPTDKPSIKRNFLTLTNPKCRDRQGNFLQLHGSSKSTLRKGCSWVAEDTAVRCPLIGDRFCPETCKVARCQG